jgi:hypothetical protein
MRAVNNTPATPRAYLTANTARSHAASFSKPGGELTWLCPDLIAQLFVEGQNKLLDRYNMHSEICDNLAQSALSCEYDSCLEVGGFRLKPVTKRCSCVQ